MSDLIWESRITITTPPFLPTFLLSFLPSLLPSFQLSLLPFFLPSFHFSFPPSFLPSFQLFFPLSFLPSFLPTFLPPFLPSFLPTNFSSLFPSFLPFFQLSFPPSCLPLILYISQKFIIARFAAFEWNKLHQILNIVFISPKRLTYAFSSIFLSLCLVYSLILSSVGCSYIPKGTFLKHRLSLVFVFLLTIRGPDFLQGRNKTFTLV